MIMVTVGDGTILACGKLGVTVELGGDNGVVIKKTVEDGEEDDGKSASESAAATVDVAVPEYVDILATCIPADKCEDSDNLDTTEHALASILLGTW